MSIQGSIAGTPHSILHDDQRQRCEVWTRVMGYHRPVSSFNIGKKAEHNERRFFSESAGGDRSTLAA
jgi:hypothetical protein